MYLMKEQLLLHVAALKFSMSGISDISNTCMSDTAVKSNIFNKAFIGAHFIIKGVVIRWVEPQLLT